MTLKRKLKLLTRATSQLHDILKHAERHVRHDIGPVTEELILEMVQGLRTYIEREHPRFVDIDKFMTDVEDRIRKKHDLPRS
jgi:hypothetical protein